jgi:hypothetical protein
MAIPSAATTGNTGRSAAYCGPCWPRDIRLMPLWTTLSRLVMSPWRFQRHRAVTVRTDIVFVIKFAGNGPVDPRLGPRGVELSCYIPDGVLWTQINYGQAEGQVLIDGREWGFYWHGPQELSVVLHDGVIDAEAALKFVHAVAEKVSSGRISYEVLLGKADK